ncbi:MAG: peptidylprolyl isomerase [Candidatus Aenigmarchaeota archaeon]|nr:peptidylprolyl isomerase [Candidatus Aenigmarchaeota archaeon]
MSDTVEKGDHVYVHYTGKLEDGTVFDSSEGRNPLDFIAGAGQMIKGFDDAVIGMTLGEKKTVMIKPEDAYGMRDPSNIILVPRSQVPDGVKEGDTLYANGQPIKVVKVTNETVTIDTNHFLAGKTLIFDITIVKIEKN